MKKEIGCIGCCFDHNNDVDVDVDVDDGLTQQPGYGTFPAPSVSSSSDSVPSAALSAPFQSQASLLLSSQQEDRVDSAEQEVDSATEAVVIDIPEGDSSDESSSLESSSWRSAFTNCLSSTCINRLVQVTTWFGIAGFAAGVSCSAYGVASVGVPLVLAGGLSFQVAELTCLMRLLLSSDAPRWKKVMAAAMCLMNMAMTCCTATILSGEFPEAVALMTYIKGALCVGVGGVGLLCTVLSFMKRCDDSSPWQCKDTVFTLAGMSFSAGNLMLAVSMMAGSEMTPVHETILAIAGLGVFAVAQFGVDEVSGMCCGASSTATLDVDEEVDRILVQHDVSAEAVAGHLRDLIDVAGAEVEGSSVHGLEEGDSSSMREFYDPDEDSDEECFDCLDDE